MLRVVVEPDDRGVAAALGCLGCLGAFSAFTLAALGVFLFVAFAALAIDAESGSNHNAFSKATKIGRAHV